MKLNNEYIEKLKNVDLEWDFEYFEFLDGDDEPGLYLLRGEDAKTWKKAKGWSEENIEENSSIEFSQTEIAEIQSNAISNESCPEHDKILLDHLLNLM